MTAIDVKPHLKPGSSALWRQELLLWLDRQEGCWTIRIGDARHGPAGVISEKLLPNVVVTADGADHSRLLEVVVELPGFDVHSPFDSQTMHLLRRLFGSRILQPMLRPDDLQAGVGPGLVHPSVAMTQWRIGRLISMLDCDDDSRTASPWWAVEKTLLAASLELTTVARDLARVACVELRYGARRINASAPLLPRARRRVVDLTAVIRWLDPGNPHLEWMRSLCRRFPLSIREISPPRSRDRGPSMTPRRRRRTNDEGDYRQPGPVENYEVDLQQSLLDELVVDRGRGADVAWTRYSGVMEVSVHVMRGAQVGDVSSHWARLHQARPGELPHLRDLSELTPTDQSHVARARLLVSGAGEGLEGLRLDVTNEPETSPVSDPSMSRFEAIATGRRAVHQESCLDWERAAVSWQLCAERWISGERVALAALATKRAGLAERAAQRPDSAARLEQLAYELADSLAQPWVFEHMGRLRPKVPPFDADLLN